MCAAGSRASTAWTKATGAVNANTSGNMAVIVTPMVPRLFRSGGASGAVVAHDHDGRARRADAEREQAEARDE